MMIGEAIKRAGNGDAEKYGLITRGGSFLMLAIVMPILIVFGCGGTGPLPPSDTTAPAVSSVSPINGAQNVPVDSSVMITFSEAMDASSINAQTIKLSTAGLDVVGSVTYSGTTAVLKPTSTLNSLTLYSVSIDASVRDAAGNAMGATVGTIFKTGSMRPGVLATTPTDGAVDRPVNASISVTFSEQMDPDTINNSTITLRAGSVSLPGTVTYAGTTAIFNPANMLTYSTLYTVSVSTSAKDIAGNSLLGNQPNGDYEWTFTTGVAPDTTPPLVTEATPTNGGSGVDVSTAITVTFSEPVNESTIHFVLSAGSTTVPWTMSYLGSTATFTTSGLSYNTLYTAEVTGAKDLAQNQMINYAWSFLTAKAGTITSLLSNYNPSIFNASVTFTAHVASGGGTPTGNVTFKDNGTNIGTATLSGGIAPLSTSILTVGSHSITAEYNGDTNFPPSTSSPITQVVNKAAAKVTLGSLNHTYDGTPKSATATTNPVGLTVTFTYDGSSTAPTNAGSYTVVGTINDASYQGSATGTMVISEGNATVTLGNLSHTYDGTPKSATATTKPAGLTVTFTYNGSSTAPTNAGSYTVIGTINDANYQGSATGTMIINKAIATVTLGSLNQTYDGTSKSATATTNPADLTVTFTYNGSPTAPTNAGSYTVIGTINDANYQGSATGTMIINKAIATVTLGGLSQTYDGMPKSATATTSPGGLLVDFTYDGSSAAPTNAGSYAVVGTIVSPNYQGSGTGTLVINKATPVITWAAPADITFGTALSATQLNATASIGGGFVYTPGAGTVLDAGPNQTLSVAFTPNDTANYNNAAASVLINVNKANATVTLGSLSQTYDGLPKSATATPNPFGLIVEITYNGSLLAPTNAGSYAVVGTIVSPNYQGIATGTLVINKAAPAITWNDPAAITYGTALSAAQLDATANVSGSFVYTPAVGTVLNAGPSQTLSVEFTPNDSANYNNATASVQINVNKADQTITFDTLAAKTLVDPPFNLTAFASSGLPVTYDSSDPAVATINGSTVTITGPGTTTITASQSGDSNYNAAENVAQTLTVSE